MQVFVVFNVSRPNEVGAALQNHFPHDHVMLREGEWLVAAAQSTTREISDRLGITEGENGNAIIAGVDTYWGRASNSIWEWISSRKVAANGQ